MARTRKCLLLLCVAAAALALVEAGGYRNGHKAPSRTEAELSLNYETPALLSKHHKLPRHFDWCGREDEGGENLCVASWNQHIPIYCGACWAHGALSMIQDRLKIRKQGKGVDVMLSRQALLNCGAFDGFGGGCDGGDVIDVFHYMTKYGLPDESCALYSATDHTKFNGSDTCPPEGICTNCMPVNGTDMCWPVKTPLLYSLKSYGQLKGGEAAMRAEIHKNGPLACGIACPENFVYKYRGGIWHDDKKDLEIDHDIEVVGWGEEDGVKFWKVRNSWGTFWGEQGFFRVERGVNALQIESGDCWVAEPDYQMERDMDDGKLEGTMFGVVKATPKHNNRSKRRGKMANILKSVTGAAGKYIIRM